MLMLEEKLGQARCSQVILVEHPRTFKWVFEDGTEIIVKKFDISTRDGHALAKYAAKAGFGTEEHIFDDLLGLEDYNPGVLFDCDLPIEGYTED